MPLVAASCFCDFSSAPHSTQFDASAENVQLKPGTLDFAAFCALVREREIGPHEPEELRKRFKALDINGTGFIEKHEYLRYALRDALARSHSQVVQILEAWDDDGDGEVDQHEFRRAVRSLGFGALHAEPTCSDVRRREPSSAWEPLAAHARWCSTLILLAAQPTSPTASSTKYFSSSTRIVPVLLVGSRSTAVSKSTPT